MNHSGKRKAAQAKAIIDRSFAERAELQGKLNALGITRRHLTEVFELAFWLSPEQYITQVRFSRAKELLEAGMRITDVAFAVGMESSAAFTTFFKKQAGVSPSGYIAQRIAEHPHCFVETPLGIIRIEENRYGITSLQFADGETKPDGRVQGRYLPEAAAQISEYFAGKRNVFDLPLSLLGTEFQQRVWKALRDIPYGETRSYQEVAAAIGNPKATRAVGMANNRNPVIIVIPCHRVVGKDGKLVGYAGGIERKQYLLEMEAGR